uniref:Uncharacterized protein n=1 Tax=Oryza sativa subsp. japonica TaxID=39947 RepID=Q6ETC1_ORYSJ|nr:hypothetical protein [Oryza sativa Japonica Group]
MRVDLGGVVRVWVGETGGKERGGGGGGGGVVGSEQGMPESEMGDDDTDSVDYAAEMEAEAARNGSVWSAAYAARAGVY